MRRGRTKQFWAREAMAPTPAGWEAGAHAVRAKRWRRLVRANFVAFPVAVLALIIVVSQLVTSQSGGAGTTGGDGVPTVVRAEALSAVGEWLGSDDPPLANAEVAGWDGAERLEWPEFTEEEDRTWEAWVARVLVSSDAGVYVAGVQVVVGADGAAATGAPSLEVVPSAAGGPSASGGARWPGTSSAPASDTVVRAVRAWAQAYISGDAAALTTVVADPDTTHSYLPVSGFTSVTPTVDGAAWRAYARGDDPDTSQMMVAVTLSVERDGMSRPVPMSFDLLVTDPTTGAARVTAWGASGSGPTLLPYGNAVSAGATGDSSPSPAAPTPSASGEAVPTGGTPTKPTSTPTQR
ncbi:hypothetical protein [Actinomyces gaoshouyii]|uniref:hypothetical protein n=1 Tax=Actinomyces gaoshouyii TaxID=1960083 RepID=UPI0009BC9B15|nr:hypothetical protein [Actinomyces gaoshouyii]ARD42528.1 hypothetical protein B6G06_09375 [Actinomyces gaoshouyii]